MAEPIEQSARATTEATQQNIRTIARLEQDAMERRTLGERIGDAFTRVMGSLTFVVFHLLGFIAWFAINLGLVPGLEPFDPFRVCIRPKGQIIRPVAEDVRPMP